MATSTVENYIKQIYLRQPENGGLLAMGELADRLAVAPGTATAMVKTLADAELVRYEPRAGARLTARGEKLALHVLRRHRLVELFLVRILGMDWSEIHEEAEQLEHVISDRVLERIDALLERPKFDPHGDPIPSAEGELTTRALHPLVEQPPGWVGVVGRIVDQSEGFLAFVHQHGLRPGARLAVEERSGPAGMMTVRLIADDRRVSLGFAAAEKIELESGGPNNI
jgi:DtxR family transcriptional regulator, Mn-dependent transcriptional regulator